LRLKTAFITHNDCLLHDTGEGHPECARRLSAIEDRLIASGLMDFLRVIDAPLAHEEQIARVHSSDYLDLLRVCMPSEGYNRLDQDTVVSPKTWPAALRAAGAVVRAVDGIMAGDFDNAFCSVRPPGHHAEIFKALGFCLLNNIAVGAAHALEEHGLQRVAVLDFDVHQGNGTEQMFADDERVLFCSTFQHPFYPFTPLLENTERRVNCPLDAGTTGEVFRTAVTDHWLPALERFQPEMIFVSAGFDGHREDDMSHLLLNDEDYRWVSEQIMTVAAAHAGNRLVSTLEGGYDFDSLARCVEQHLRVLMNLH
jgi:acetoin utilization deacetylase AcuC-like enzyme